MILPWFVPVLGSGTLAFTWYGAERIARPARMRSAQLPSDYGLPYRAVDFASADGVALRGWLIPSPEARGAVIVCHGYGCDKAAGLDCAAFLWPTFDVLLFDMRGHGESAGPHTSLGYLEARDVAGAVRYLQAERPGPLGILGHSMGAATAILAAGQVPALRAVVADNAFVGLQEAVRCGLVRYGYPRVFARVAAPLLAAALGVRMGIPATAGDPVAAIPRIAPRPLFLIHGAQDGYIPAWHSRALYRAARAPKRLWLVDGADHCQAHHCAGPVYEREVLDFFRAALASEPARAPS
jgi:pimeloyl-ACP methyl ester carboxylesterase